MERAIKAHILQSHTGHASKAKLKAKVSKKPNPSQIFKHSKIAVSDIKNAKQIFGTSLSCLKGKWVRKNWSGWTRIAC